MPDGHMPVVQSYPRGAVRIVDQAPGAVTVENISDRRVFFLIVYASPSDLEVGMAIGQLASAWGRRRQQKSRGKK
jgi:hypothetical protein